MEQYFLNINVTEQCRIIGAGESATTKVIERLLEVREADFTVTLLDSKTIVELFKKDRMAAGLWRTNRQLGVSTSEKLCDYRPLRKMADAMPASELREDLIFASKSMNAIKKAVSERSGALKRAQDAPEKEAKKEEQRVAMEMVKLNGIDPNQCPITTIWDSEFKYIISFPVVEYTTSVSENRDGIKTFLASLTGKETKAQILATLASIVA